MPVFDVKNPHNECRIVSSILYKHNSVNETMEPTSDLLQDHLDVSEYQITTM